MKGSSRSIAPCPTSVKSNFDQEVLEAWLKFRRIGLDRTSDETFLQDRRNRPETVVDYHTHRR